MDQIEKIVQTKLTQSQKRGLRPGKANSREYMNDRRNLEPVKPREDAELSAAQRRLADLALTKDDPQAWLSDVLRALGLHRVISAS